MNILKRAIVFKKNINKHGLLFHYNIRTDTFSGIGYFDVSWIPCSCLVCLRKLYNPWNRSQGKYKQDQHKGENQNCVY